MATKFLWFQAEMKRYIACTRFNNDTYRENQLYRALKNETVIYGSPLKIRSIYPPECILFVAEMNNTTNQIEGIGCICNKLIFNTHKIYSNIDYNRYIYRGNYWLSRDSLLATDADIVIMLENALFKKKTHLKCRVGITVITDKLLSKWEYRHDELLAKIRTAFQRLTAESVVEKI